MKVDMETQIAREQKQFKNQLALLSHYTAENGRPRDMKYFVSGPHAGTGSLDSGFTTSCWLPL